MFDKSYSILQVCGSPQGIHTFSVASRFASAVDRKEFLFTAFPFSSECQVVAVVVSSQY